MNSMEYSMTGEASVSWGVKKDLWEVTMEA